MIVVDTNVLAYFLIAGDRTPTAEAVYRRDSYWIAPSLWRYELLNVLSLYVRKQMTTRVGALEVMVRANAAIKRSYPFAQPRRMLELSEHTGCATYDCEFVVLAQMKNLPLITADAKVVKTFPTIALSMDAYLAQP